MFACVNLHHLKVAQVARTMRLNSLKLGYIKNHPESPH